MLRQKPEEDSCPQNAGGKVVVFPVDQIQQMFHSRFKFLVCEHPVVQGHGLCGLGVAIDPAGRVIDKLPANIRRHGGGKLQREAAETVLSQLAEEERRLSGDVHSHDAVRHRDDLVKTLNPSEYSATAAPERLVVAEGGKEIDALRYMAQLQEQKIAAEFCLLEDVGDAMAYARDRGIKHVDIVTDGIETVDSPEDNQ